MAKFEFEVECFLGMSHCGSVTTDGKGIVDLTDEEVAQLVSLIKEKGTADVKDLNLEETLPEIYEKLNDAHYQAAYDAIYDYWLWEGYHEVDLEYDVEDLIEYCKEKHGFEYISDYLFDEDDEDEAEEFREAEQTAFYEWLDPALKQMTYSERRTIIEDYMGLEMEFDGVSEDEYLVAIPDEIIKMAKEK